MVIFYSKLLVYLRVPYIDLRIHWFQRNQQSSPTHNSWQNLVMFVERTVWFLYPHDTPIASKKKLVMLVVGMVVDHVPYIKSIHEYIYIAYPHHILIIYIYTYIYIHIYTYIYINKLMCIPGVSLGISSSHLVSGSQQSQIVSGWLAEHPNAATVSLSKLFPISFTYFT